MRASFDDIVQNFDGRLQAMANSYASPFAPAADLMQEAHLRLWKRLPDFDPAKGSLPAFVTMIARDAMLERATGRRSWTGSEAQGVERQQPLLLGEFMPEPKPADDIADLICDRDELQRALRILDDRERDIVVSMSAFGMTSAEVGGRLGITESRVRQIHRRAISRLRAAMQFDSMESSC